MESSDNYQVCRKKFDGFFNWTSTYRLDSDIPFAYITVKNSNGKVVGPKKDMIWPSDFPEISENYTEKLANKSKAVAWFVSHCSSRSGRKNMTERLQRSLSIL
ncbi:Alpha-(1,3)-fucosyltransferase C [Operophtera brumata]|uniref:Alpha-(1,3)-fucosyltransferase C n=1 Tax=Operophtera brumata TaxID=104452 RepID=A0A0L7LCE4_OPEBR|nr:Alpha-(1,3)-fucosyltransferase C [Operophtera brumata]